MALKFIQDGDYVNFFHDSYHVIRLHNTSRAVTWFYNDTGGLIFAIDNLRYQVDNVADITFNGTPLASQGQFKTKIIEFFPDLAPGGGPDGGVTTMGSVGAGDAEGAVITGSTLALHKATETFPGLVSVDGTVQTFGGPKSFSGTVQLQNQVTFNSNQKIAEIAVPSAPAAGFGYLYAKTDKKIYFKNSDNVESDLTASGGGIDTVLAVGQALTADRTVDLNGKKLFISQGGIYFIEVDPDPLNQQTNIRALNGLAENLNESHLIVRTTDTEVTWRLQADYHDGTKRAQIEAEVNNESAILNHQADVHNFNGIVNLDTGINAAGIEIAATFAAISVSIKKRLIIVTADETNNGDGSLYIHNGTTPIFLLTIPA